MYAPTVGASYLFTERITFVQSQEATESVIDYANKSGLVSLKHGDQLVIVARRSNEIGNVLDDQRLAARVFMVGNAPAIERPFKVRLCLLASQ